MRRLLLLRHAKAEPLSATDDYARELTERGREEARKIGRFLAARPLTPDLALHSGAKRTRQTLELVADALPHPFAQEEQGALYDATRFLIMGLLRELPARAQVPLIVGHNPGMAEVAYLLSGEGAATDRLRLQAKFPPGALAVIAFDRPNWSELGAGCGRLELFVTPADL